MVRRRMLFVVAAVVACASASGGGTASAASTTFSASFFNANGTAMQNAEVAVFAMPSSDNDGSAHSLPLLYQGVASTGTVANAAIDTSAVASADINDLGETNVLVTAYNPATGDESVSEQVVTVGDTAQAGSLTADETGQFVQQGQTAGTSETASVTTLGTSYREVPVLGFNVADGMSAVFHMSRTASSSFETKAQVPVTDNDGNTWATLGWHAETGAQSGQSSPFVETDSFHEHVWANYVFDHEQTVTCAPRGPCTTRRFWQLDHWTGSLVANNPNTNKSGAVIGVVPTTIPTFDTNLNHQIVLTASGQKAWTRNKSRTANYGFSFALADYLSIDDESTYGAQSSVTWTYSAGVCSQRRVLWGSGVDPSVAGVVQATCHA